MQLDAAVVTLDIALRDLKDLGAKKLEGLTKLHMQYRARPEKFAKHND